MPLSRRTESQRTRNEAAELAAHRPHPEHVHNNEEQEYRAFEKPKSSGCTISSRVSHIANYTKGLPHDVVTGLLLNPTDYKLFVTGIQSGDPQDFKNTPLGPAGDDIPGTESLTAKKKERQHFREQVVSSNAPTKEAITRHTSGADRATIWQSAMAQNAEANVRAWESAGAGNVFDLEGPDAQAVTMPPAPRFDSEELLAEIAEVYAMALCRDVPFEAFNDPLSDASLRDAYEMLQEMDWFNADRVRKGKSGGRKGRTRLARYKGRDCKEHDEIYEPCFIPNLTPEEMSRRRTLDRPEKLFRGTAPGEEIGPYLSQFLLLGNYSLEQNGAICDGRSARQPELGFISYGAISIEQKVRVATPCKDYMTKWEQFVDVQNGADLRGEETYEEDKPFRFITTPRDLATYVHYDALYEAYVNACISLLSSGAPFDRGIPFLEADVYDKQQGFAHFGGPHILTLVAEVATRALKAVRYQKFNVHRRLRPEAMGGLYDRYENLKQGSKRVKDAIDCLLPHRAMEPFAMIGHGLSCLEWGGNALSDEIAKHNQENNAAYFDGSGDFDDSYLLPMAFPEGSPMHPAYGAGHATVAGACVTILKAYFDHGWTPPEWIDDKGRGIAWYPDASGEHLVDMRVGRPLTIEGELNKLCANIAIGRNWAGVHYYTDYIESIRMGERIAIGMLEEQKLTYPENFSMTVPLFDGGAVRI